MDPRRLSACTYPYRDRPWGEALSLIKEAGFDKVDLLGRAPHLALDGPSNDAEPIEAAARRLGLRIANLGTYAGRGFASTDSHVQVSEYGRLERTIDVAVLFGARSIRVSPGDDTMECIERIVPWFRQAAAYAGARGVYMGFETHGGGISGWPLHCVELVDRVGSPHFGVVYDPCNLMRGGADYRMALWSLRGRIAHVHVKDGQVGPGGFRLTMLGEGQLDMPWIVGTLDATGYTGDLALEYELDAPPPETGLAVWRRVASAF
jgi:sugar phosphate isomerase/epimerase